MARLAVPLKGLRDRRARALLPPTTWTRRSARRCPRASKASRARLRDRRRSTLPDDGARRLAGRTSSPPRRRRCHARLDAHAAAGLLAAGARAARARHFAAGDDATSRRCVARPRSSIHGGGVRESGRAACAVPADSDADDRRNRHRRRAAIDRTLMLHRRSSCGRSTTSACRRSRCPAASSRAGCRSGCSWSGGRSPRTCSSVGHAFQRATEWHRRERADERPLVSRSRIRPSASPAASGRSTR